MPFRRVAIRGRRGAPPPAPVVEPAAVLLEMDAVAGVFVTGVLAPVDGPFLPGEPWIAAAVDGDAGAHFGQGRRRYGYGRGLVGPPREYVVAVRAVGVPGNPRSSGGVHGNRRFPVVIGRCSEVDRASPFSVFESAQKDVALRHAPGRVLTPACPDQGKSARGVSGQSVKCVGTRIVGEAGRRPTSCRRQTTWRRDRSCRSRVRFAARKRTRCGLARSSPRGNAEMVARRRDGLRSGPAAAVRAVRDADFIGACVEIPIAAAGFVGDPGEPVFSRAGAHHAGWESSNAAVVTVWGRGTRSMPMPKLFAILP